MREDKNVNILSSWSIHESAGVLGNPPSNSPTGALERRGVGADGGVSWPDLAGGNRRPGPVLVDSGGHRTPNIPVARPVETRGKLYPSRSGLATLEHKAKPWKMGLDLEVDLLLRDPCYGRSK